MKLLSLFCLFLFLFSCTAKPKGKTVFVAILARNQAHFLPRYLKNLEQLDYDKKLMTIYVNTNNNQDNSEEILKNWVEKNKSVYASIIFEPHTIPNLESSSGHLWSTERLRVIGAIRNKTLDLARKSGCDYYFVSDCDNFVAPHTLKTLIAKNKPIIAPMLYDIPDPEDYNVNCYSSINDSGYFSLDRFWSHIFLKTLTGTMKVPVVHCTYLVKGEYLDRLTYVDGTDSHEFVIFCRSARASGVDQFICNEKDFGVQFAFMNKNMSLEEEITITRPFLSLP